MSRYKDHVLELLFACDPLSVNLSRVQKIEFANLKYNAKF